MAIDITIRKQKIKIVTASEQYALQIRKTLNDRLAYDLIAVLESVFSSRFSSNEYVTIDKLKVDLGRIAPDTFERHFIELVEPKLQRALQTMAETNDNLLLKRAQLFTDEKNASVNSSSKQEQEIKALLYFLEHGIYPWWYKKGERQTPAALLGNLSKEATDTLLLHIVSIKQYEPMEKVMKITDRLFTYLPDSLSESLINKLLDLYNNPLLTNNTDILIKNKQALIESSAVTEQMLYKKIFQLLVDQDSIKARNIIEQLIKGLNQEKAPDGQSSLKDTLKDITNNTGNKKATTPSKTEQEGIYISNAGLILMSPFLPAFFRELNLVDTTYQFVSLAAQQEAAVLLYYLQCNSGEYQEWEMAFNKILCGIPVDDVLPAEITIPEAEMEEGRLLLQRIVDYWEALKGASIEAVQNTFILREGKVTWKEDRWLLQVERMGADILLDRLPWSFSIIKLPWLNYLIYTEW